MSILFTLFSRFTSSPSPSPFFSIKFHLYSGVRAGGGIGDELDAPYGDPLEYWRMIFDYSFFLFVIIILLAIIQGTMITKKGGGGGETFIITKFLVNKLSEINFPIVSC